MEKSAPIYRRQTDHIFADMYLYVCLCVCPRGQSEGAQILFMMIVKASRYHLQKQFIMHCIPPSMYLHGCHYPCQRHSRASRYHWQRQFIIRSIHTNDLYMYLLRSSKYSKGKKTSLLIEKMQQCQQDKYTYYKIPLTEKQFITRCIGSSSSIGSFLCYIDAPFICIAHHQPTIW